MGPLALLIHVDALLSIWMGNWSSEWNGSRSHAAELFSLDCLEDIDILIVLIIKEVWLSGSKIDLST